MTPTVYVGDHQHAKVVCSAFAEGCHGKLAAATSPLQPGPAAMWGILRGAGDRIKECELYGKPYFYIDHGYFNRGHYDGYYRVVFCDRHLRVTPRPCSTIRHRPEQAEYDLYLPISRHVAEFLGWNADEFDKECSERLHNLFRRDISVCRKGDGKFSERLESAGSVYGFETNALIEAHAAGHSVFELGNSPALLLNGAIAKVDVFASLADNQWTLAEMRSGKCWSDLMARYGDQLEDMV